MDCKPEPSSSREYNMLSPCLMIKYVQVPGGSRLRVLRVLYLIPTPLFLKDIAYLRYSYPQKRMNKITTGAPKGSFSHFRPGDDVGCESSFRGLDSRRMRCNVAHAVAIGFPQLLTTSCYDSENRGIYLLFCEIFPLGYLSPPMPSIGVSLGGLETSMLTQTR